MGSGIPEPSMTVNDLDDTTKGRIDGLLEAADILIEKRKYHDDQLENGRAEDHHQSCKNTCNNMAKDLQREAVEIAMDAAE